MAREDLTGAHDPRILKAIRTIGQGLTDLADALTSPFPSASDEEPEPRPAARRSPRTAPPPAGEETQEEKLADLQVLAKDLVKKNRPALVKILEDYEFETVSSAPEEFWPQLKKQLEEALAAE